MNMTSIKAWAGEQTTILGAMCAVGAAVGYSSHALNLGTALTLVAVGVIGAVLRETPQQVIAQAQSLLGQAQTAKAAADAMSATAQKIIDATTPPAAVPPVAPLIIQP